MVRKSSLIVVVLFALLLAVAPFAAAQTQTGLTRSTASVDQPSGGGIWRFDAGESTGVLVFNVAICYAGPAVNPQDGKFVATLTIDGGPEWATVATPTPNTFEVVLPQTHLSQDEVCEDGTFDVNPVIAATAPAGATGTVTATMAVTASGDLGTFDQGAAQSHPLTVEIGVTEAEDDPLSPTGGANATDDPDGNDNAESPGVMPLTAVLTVLALLFVRRRR